MPALNVALIGYGFMGKAHSSAYAQVGHFFPHLPKVRRKVVCGRGRAGLEALARAWDWEEAETDWRRVIERSDIDVVDVCTPNFLHAEIAIAAAAAGKMVLCEKPLANTLAEAEAMVAAAAHVPTFVWFNYRRVPAVELAESLMRQGRIGRIYQYRACYLQQWGPDPNRPNSWKMSKRTAGSGANGDLNSHLLDTALMLMGPIREVSATMQTFLPEKPDPGRPGQTYQVDIDDAVLVQARFASGALGSFEATRFATGVQNDKSFTAHGDSGMLEFHFEDLNHLIYADMASEPDLRGRRRILAPSTGPPGSPHFWKPGHPIGYEHTFTKSLADFLAGVDSGKPARPTFEDGLAVQRLLDAVERSARDRRWVDLEGEQARPGGAGSGGIAPTEASAEVGSRTSPPVKSIRSPLKRR
ncbi:MAG: Gfo/Idh/MocA family oxidoreductase [Bryobacterales bacterium]|nr:Gfo/Idh/MocA family oxidoreductase [Bryobacterales bacterium]